MESNRFQEEFIENACYRMDESLRMINKSLLQMKEEDIWKRPNANSNSIGNLILHLCGNISQYAISSLSGETDTRNRDAEFEAFEGHTKGQLVSKLEEVVRIAKATITEASEPELLRVRKVQGYTFSRIGIIIHVLEHFSYHTGQIAFWVKQLTNEQLGFYDGVDLNVLNED